MCYVWKVEMADPRDGGMGLFSCQVVTTTAERAIALARVTINDRLDRRNGSADFPPPALAATSVKMESGPVEVDWALMDGGDQSANGA